MSAKDSIAIQTCKLSEEEFNEFLALYSIPSLSYVILPKSKQTVLDAPPGYVGLYTYSFFSLIIEMAFRNFVYATDEEDLSFLPKEPSPAFGTGSPSVSVNIEPLMTDKEHVLQPTEATTDSGGSLKRELFVVYPRSVADRRKCKTRGGSSRPLVKRRLTPGSLTARATRAKCDNRDLSRDDDTIYVLFYWAAFKPMGLCYPLFGSWSVAFRIWDNEDVHDLRSVITEFPAIVFNDKSTSEAALLCEPTVNFDKEIPAIVYNDALTSELDFLTEPTVSPQYIDKFNLKDETSLSVCDEK
ncbi:hypothetical protein Tco_0551906 [Tanacetum coccineum]